MRGRRRVGEELEGERCINGWERASETEAKVRKGGERNRRRRGSHCTCKLTMTISAPDAARPNDW